MNYEEVASDCIDVARFAGGYLSEHYGKAIPREKMAVLPEGVDPATFNVVTDVDINLQREVIKRLMEKYGNFEYYGEEDPNKVFDLERDRELINQIQNNRSKYQFVIDPLDGTGRYASRDARHGFFLGLLEDNHFALSVGYNPKQDSLTHAIKGKGCFRNGKRFFFDSSVDDHVAINSKADRNTGFKNDLIKENLFLMRPKHTGTMYDMLFLQYAQALISLKSNTHDHPLTLAVQEAGGSVLVYDGNDFVSGTDFDWRKESSKKDGNIPAIICANSLDNVKKYADLALKHL